MLRVWILGLILATGATGHADVGPRRPDSTDREPRAQSEGRERREDRERRVESTGSGAPSATMRPEKPSGFWGGADRGPGAYRWKLLVLGVALVMVTGGALYVLLRRASAQRPR